MGKPNRICYAGGCTNLALPGRQHCVKHSKDRGPFVEGFKRDPDKVKFYSGYAWVRVRKAFRVANPLCEECKAKGIITPSQMVHHAPELDELIKDGKDPYAWEYLHALCNKCHLDHLRQRRTSVNTGARMGEGIPKCLRSLALYR